MRTYRRARTGRSGEAGSDAEGLAGGPARSFFCDERVHESGGGSFRKALVDHAGPGAILIGPEGGFTDTENDAIRALPQAVPVSLGPRILRADTAAVAAISLWMAGRGDWTAPSR